VLVDVVDVVVDVVVYVTVVLLRFKVRLVALVALKGIMKKSSNVRLVILLQFPGAQVVVVMVVVVVEVVVLVVVVDVVVVVEVVLVVVVAVMGQTGGRHSPFPVKKVSYCGQVHIPL